MYKGSLPPPSMMEAFKNVDPSLPNRITLMAEKALECKKAEIDNNRYEIESARAVKELEIESRNEDLKYKNRIFLCGQIFSFIVCLVLIVLGFYKDQMAIVIVGASPIVIACVKNLSPKK